MSALAPMVINTLLGNQMSHGSGTPGLSSSVTEKTFADLVRKQYSDHHYDSYGHSGHSGHSYPSYSYHGGYGGKKKSKSIALSALTLLAFLFFLHILQQCLQDQMTTPTPQVVVMQATIKAAREAEAKLKEAQKRVGLSETTKVTDNVGTVKKFENNPDEDLYQYETAAKQINRKN